jgi:hypothetical protein
VHDVCVCDCLIPVLDILYIYVNAVLVGGMISILGECTGIYLSSPQVTDVHREFKLFVDR